MMDRTVSTLEMLMVLCGSRYLDNKASPGKGLSLENVTKNYGNKAGGNGGTSSSGVLFDLRFERHAGILVKTVGMTC